MRVRLIWRCAAGDLAGHRVEGQVGERHRRRFGVVVGLGAAQQRAHPGQQFFQRERLGQIVVGAGIEAGDPLGHRVAGGEHQDGQVVAGAAELTAHLEAVQPRHHHVEHDRVGPIVGDQIERFDAVLGQRDGVAVEGKRAAQRLAHRAIVVNDKYSHGHQCQPIA